MMILFYLIRFVFNAKDKCKKQENPKVFVLTGVFDDVVSLEENFDTIRLYVIDSLLNNFIINDFELLKKCIKNAKIQHNDEPQFLIQKIHFEFYIEILNIISQTINFKKSKPSITKAQNDFNSNYQIILSFFTNNYLKISLITNGNQINHLNNYFSSNIKSLTNHLHIIFYIILKAQKSKKDNSFYTAALSEIKQSRIKESIKFFILNRKITKNNAYDLQIQNCNFKTFFDKTQLQKEMKNIADIANLLETKKYYVFVDSFYFLSLYPFELTFFMKKHKKELIDIIISNTECKNKSWSGCNKERNICKKSELCVIKCNYKERRIDDFMNSLCEKKDKIAIQEFMLLMNHQLRMTKDIFGPFCKNEIVLWMVEDNLAETLNVIQINKIETLDDYQKSIKKKETNKIKKDIQTAKDNDRIEYKSKNKKLPETINESSADLKNSCHDQKTQCIENFEIDYDFAIETYNRFNFEKKTPSVTQKELKFFDDKQKYKMTNKNILNKEEEISKNNIDVKKETKIVNNKSKIGNKTDLKIFNFEKVKKIEKNTNKYRSETNKLLYRNYSNYKENRLSSNEKIENSIKISEIDLCSDEKDIENYIKEIDSILQNNQISNIKPFSSSFDNYIFNDCNDKNYFHKLNQDLLNYINYILINPLLF